VLPLIVIVLSSHSMIVGFRRNRQLYKELGQQRSQGPGLAMRPAIHGFVPAATALAVLIIPVLVSHLRAPIQPIERLDTSGKLAATGPASTWNDSSSLLWFVQASMLNPDNIGWI
jgi:hypothetical protein